MTVNLHSMTLGLTLTDIKSHDRVIFNPILCVNWIRESITDHLVLVIFPLGPINVDNSCSGTIMTGPCVHYFTMHQSLSRDGVIITITQAMEANTSHRV